VWHEIFTGSNFCDFCGFFHDPQKNVPAKKNSRKKFSSSQKFTPLAKLYIQIHMKNLGATYLKRFCRSETKSGSVVFADPLSEQSATLGQDVIV